MCGASELVVDETGPSDEPLQARRTNLAVVAVLGTIIVVLTCAVYFWSGRTQTAAQGPPANVTRPSVVETSPSTETPPAPAAATVVTPPVAAHKSAPETTKDPIELWKRVRRGNTEAEIELAMMYLDGRQVSQNCEQAHLLLLAAAKKQTTKSTDLLSQLYTERCR